MLSRRAISTVFLIPVVISLAACSTTTKGHGSPGGPGGQTIGPAPTDAPGLADAMQQGAKSITTAHLSLDIAVGGQRVRGAGDEALSGGKLTGLDLSETVANIGTLRLRIVGEETFVALPKSLNRSNKPWTVVSADSSDPVIKSLSATVKSARDAVSLNTETTFVDTATSLRLIGSEQVNGAPASHYSIAVDVTKLPPDYPGRDALMSAGIKTLPVELWIDGQGRPVRMSEKFSAQGQVVSSLINMTKFNAPLHITPPPPSEVNPS